MRAKVILIFFVIYGFVVIQARVMTLSENQVTTQYIEHNWVMIFILL